MIGCAFTGYDISAANAGADIKPMPNTAPRRSFFISSPQAFNCIRIESKLPLGIVHLGNT